jgi:hypothetical protein
MIVDLPLLCKELFYARAKRRITVTGKVTIPQIRSNTPPTATPMMRNGSKISHTMGYTNNAAIATGQQRTSNRHHSKNVNMIRL